MGDVAADSARSPTNTTSPRPHAAKTTGNKWKVTLGSAVGFSFITATGATTSGITWTNPVTVGFFYQRVGYTVLNNQLRYHPFLTDPPYPEDTGFATTCP